VVSNINWSNSAENCVTFSVRYYRLKSTKVTFEGGVILPGLTVLSVTSSETYSVETILLYVKMNPQLGSLRTDSTSSNF